MTAKDFADFYFGPNAQESPFRSDLTVNWAGDPSTAPQGTATVSKINPQYCATDHATEDLRAILADAGIATTKTSGPPLGVWPTANIYKQSGDVPWLQVSGSNVIGQPVTVLENAGQLIEAFGHGYPPQDALNTVIQWINMDLHAATPAE